MRVCSGEFNGYPAVKRREPDSIFVISNEIRHRDGCLSGLEMNRHPMDMLRRGLRTTQPLL
jgi:hypothetical protein